MKKALIITYYWPPSGGAGVQRWVKFVKYLRNSGWEPVVYVPENPHYPVLDRSFEKDIPPDITVLKHPIWEPYEFYKKFIGMKKEEKVQHGFIQEKKRNSLKLTISNWIRSNFFIPDARKFWIKPSVKYLSGYFETHEKPDIIISSGPPHSMHLIAMGLKDKLRIPWIADFRDPWTEIDFYSQLKLTKWADRKHRRLEKQVLQKADKVVYIGWHGAKRLEMLGAKEVEVITNGFDEEDIQVDSNAVNEKFVLSHTGSLNKERNHEVLWQALEDLVNENPDFKQKLQINIIGKVDRSVSESIKNHNLEPFFKKTDYLPHDKMNEIYSSSAILLLLLNNTPNIEGIITGKIFEYIATRKPVLCIGSSKGDAAKIIDETKTGKAFELDDKEKIKAFVLEKFEDYTKNILPQPDVEEIKKYSRKELTKKLAALMDKIAQKPG